VDVRVPVAEGQLLVAVTAGRGVVAPAVATGGEQRRRQDQAAEADATADEEPAARHLPGDADRSGEIGIVGTVGHGTSGFHSSGSGRSTRAVALASTTSTGPSAPGRASSAGGSTTDASGAQLIHTVSPGMGGGARRGAPGAMPGHP